MSFHYFILAFMGTAIAVTLADIAHVALRRLWRRHCEWRRIARTARLCRLYGFAPPLKDTRSSIETYKASRSAR